MVNFLDLYTKEELDQLAKELAAKLKAKTNQPDGKTCIWCQNFCPMAENNFGKIFLCHSCNLHVNRVILGLE